MPLRIHCPNGCLIRLPSSRAGKKVRCSECKATLQLPDVSESELRSGKPIPMKATLVEEAKDTSTAEDTKLPSSDEDDLVLSTATPQVDVASEKLSMGPDTHVPVFPANILDRDDEEDQAGDKANGSGTVDFSAIDIAPTTSGVEFSTVAKQIEIATDGSSKPEPEIAAISLDGVVQAKPTDLVAQQKRDHKTLARFYGFCIAALGLISLIPAIIFLVKINQADMHAMTPRWIYLLMFVGSLHVVYAVYLIQVADWSSLWAVSILMLVASFFYGIFSTAIILDDGFGPVVSFLQLTVAQLRTASIGCLVGLCFSVLTSYLCGREALHWRKNEQRLFEIAMQKRNKSSKTQHQPA